MIGHSKHKVARALNASIHKWRNIVAGLRRDRGHRDCALCALFRKKAPYAVGWAPAVTCFGCPVREATGKHGCAGTPYEDYCLATLSTNGRAKTVRQMEIAFEELRFLVLLREKIARKAKGNLPTGH